MGTSAPTLTNKFARAYNLAELGVTDVALPAAIYTQIGSVVCPAGTALQMGVGVHTGQDNAVGRIYMQLQTSVPAVITGDFRIDVQDPQNRTKDTIFQTRSELLNTSATDRREQYPFPEISAIIGRDWSFVLMFKADAANTIDTAESAALIGGTTYDVSG